MLYGVWGVSDNHKINQLFRHSLISTIIARAIIVGLPDSVSMEAGGQILVTMNRCTGILPEIWSIGQAENKILKTFEPSSLVAIK